MGSKLAIWNYYGCECYMVFQSLEGIIGQFLGPWFDCDFDPNGIDHIDLQFIQKQQGVPFTFRFDKVILYLCCHFIDIMAITVTVFIEYSALNWRLPQVGRLCSKLHLFVYRWYIKRKTVY